MISFNKMTSPLSTRSIRKKVCGCMPTPPSQFKLGHIVIRMMFYSRKQQILVGFKHHSPLAPTTLESMLTWGHNEAISMDATFGGNDVKFHLFILMVFDSHWTKILVAWIIIS